MILLEKFFAGIQLVFKRNNIKCKREKMVESIKSNIKNKNNTIHNKLKIKYLKSNINILKTKLKNIILENILLIGCNKMEKKPLKMKFFNILMKMNLKRYLQKMKLILYILLNGSIYHILNHHGNTNLILITMRKSVTLIFGINVQIKKEGSQLKSKENVIIGYQITIIVLEETD